MSECRWRLELDNGGRDLRHSLETVLVGPYADARTIRADGLKLRMVGKQANIGLPTEGTERRERWTVT